MRRTSSIDEDFTAFVASRIPAAAPQGVAAHDLVGSRGGPGAVGAGQGVRRTGGGSAPPTTPPPTSSGIVLKTFLSDRRRRSSSEVAVAEVEDATAGHRLTPPCGSTLLAALRTLPPLDRAVVVLRYWEDRSVEETAHTLHLTNAAVKNRSLRALAALRTRLDDVRELDHDPGGTPMTIHTRRSTLPRVRRAVRP